MGEWKTYKLSEIGSIVGGATPSTTVDTYYNGDIPWLTPKDLSNFHERYIERGERNITKSGLNSCSAQLLPAGSVLFSSRAPIGYVTIAKNPIATNQGFKSIIPNPEKVDSLFLYYLLKYSKDNIEAMGSGTTFKEVSGATMKNQCEFGGAGAGPLPVVVCGFRTLPRRPLCRFRIRKNPSRLESNISI